MVVDRRGAGTPHSYPRQSAPPHSGDVAAQRPRDIHSVVADAHLSTYPSPLGEYIVQISQSSITSSNNTSIREGAYTNTSVASFILVYLLHLIRKYQRASGIGTPDGVYVSVLRDSLGGGGGQKHISESDGRRTQRCLPGCGAMAMEIDLSLEGV